MFVFITVLIILVSVVLGLAVLVQNSKGGGLVSGFSAPQQIMGVRKTTDFLEKLTWGLGIGLIVLCVAANFMLPGSTSQGQVKSSSIQEQIDNAALPASPQAPLPGADQAKPAQQPAQQPATPAK
ncbi:MAG TPA: preprotein translocase subunit SecG [Bacteroidia bacterium]|nr:MAG: preprotein translocase subunit SecG [Bacteroidetes bacterium OLB10]MBE7508912.1 preprotein translocase subunit SecG [Bacteroidia bacterium]MBX3106012.1 preprotein translocase subunit SecG [Bacteroidota bacterium]MCE7956170.1 preprotein translocase subunit SecG [Bacteroidetes bacterium CHB6]OQB61546.1 MAG: preprotein translocase subunit SecG [Bacteroidetes bacterium ADurb.Bin141]